MDIHTNIHTYICTHACMTASGSSALTWNIGYLCRCDLWTVGHDSVILEHIPSIPSLHCPHTFFTSESSLHFLQIFNNYYAFLLTFLMALIWPLQMFWVCHQHQHSSCIFSCSFVYLVFHFRHTPRSREETWKATVWSTASVSEPESLRRLDSWLWRVERAIMLFCTSMELWELLLE